MAYVHRSFHLPTFFANGVVEMSSGNGAAPTPARMYLTMSYVHRSFHLPKSFANGVVEMSSEKDPAPTPALPLEEEEEEERRSSFATAPSHRSTTPSDPYHSSGLSTEWNTPSKVTCSAPSRCAYTRGTQASPDWSVGGMHIYIWRKKRRATV